MNDTKIEALIKHIEELKKSLEASHKDFLQKLEDIRKQAIKDAEQIHSKEDSKKMSELEDELDSL